MRKITVAVFTTCFLLAFIPVQVNAGTVTVSPSMPASNPAERKEANSLVLRLNEIYAMDKSNLTSSEKRVLRKEVRSTNKQLKELGGGVYLSVGAIIIILLLLILLL